VEQIQGEGGTVVGFGRIRKRSVLGCRMSKQGIRSLIIVSACSGIFWSVVVASILHATGVFNG